MNKNSRRRAIFITIITIILSYSFIGSKGEVVENLDVPIGVGIDLYGNGYYRVPVSVYVFTSSGDVTSKVISGEDSSIAGARNDRQRKANKKYLLGLEKIYILNEAYAENGIRSVIDILLNNPTISDRSPMVIYKGKVEELFNHKIEGYANSSEYIEGIIKNSVYYNFFSAQFSAMDIIVRVDAEGRSVVLPYVELGKEAPEITGLAIFKGDKMIAKTDMQEARAINLLRFNGGRGVLTVQKDPKEYINFYAQSKRKVKCTKVDGKYKFVINLDLSGSIASNELDTDINKDPKALKKITKDMENRVKESCTKYVSKIKNEYKTDVLELGAIAAGKYGKHTGVDWNKVVSESDIEVNVKITVKDEGRGAY